MANKQMGNCCMCGKDKVRGQFYTDTSGKTKIDYFPYCKSCIKSNVYSKATGYIDVNETKIMLKKMNLPFIESVYNSALKDEKETFGIYIKNLNPYFKSQGRIEGYKEVYDVSNKENKINNTHNESMYEDDENDSFEVTKDMIIFWGKGYEKDDYLYLENLYNEWTTRYKSDTLAEEKTYKFLSLKELEIRKARERGDNVDKLEETFRKLMSDANVTPRDANAANDPENMNTLGLWIKDIEKYRPAEYFEQRKLYVDFDSLKEYLTRFIFRPLKNLLVGTRDFDKEFNVENIKDEESTSEEGGEDGK